MFFLEELHKDQVNASEEFVQERYSMRTLYSTPSRTTLCVIWCFITTDSSMLRRPLHV